jgi:multidrug efflux pump subunit AcrA (membrane-fusion protein)
MAQMSPLSFDGEATWHEIDRLVSELVGLGNGNLSVHDFYVELLERAVTALAAVGGAAWRVEGRTSAVLIAEHHYPADLASESSRTSQRLFNAVSGNGPVVLSADGLSVAERVSYRSAWPLVLGPVRPDEQTGIVVEIVLEAGASREVCEGARRLLTLFCDVAVDYHRRHELSELRRREAAMRGLDQLAVKIHESLNPRVTAYTIANDGRQWIGCDRLSVLSMRGDYAKLLAVSGVDQVDRRSEDVRRLECLASAVASGGTSVAWVRGQASEFGAQLDGPVQSYVDKSHATSLLVVPLSRSTTDEPSLRNPPIVAALIAETFDDQLSEHLLRSRVALVARHAAVALGGALEHHQLPLVPLQTAIANAIQRLRRRPNSVIACIALVVALIGALCLIPADFTIEARGTLQPKISKNIYAPMDGVVEEVRVEHGEDVSLGTTLLNLRDPKLDLEVSRISGELATSSVRLASVRASRASRAKPEPHTSPRDRDRELAAEEQQLTQQIEGLESQRRVLDGLRGQLHIGSPCAGVVLTWNTHDLLENRPVKRGQLLLTVADPTGPWVLDLRVRDQDVGHVLTAQQQVNDPLPVSFLLGTDAGLTRRGLVERVALVAESEEDGAVRAAIKVKVDEDQAGEFRTGASVIARIHCGRRSIGYVWLHGLIDAVRAALWL